MADPSLVQELENALAEAGIDLVVEQHDRRLLLAGAVGTEGVRDAALDIATAVVGDALELDHDITVAGAVAAEMQDATLSEAGFGGEPGADADLEEYESVMAGDFTDQPTLSSPDDAQGASLSDADVEMDSHRTDLTSEGDFVYVPPIDPAGGAEEVIAGFTSSSLDNLEVPRSSDGTLGDEAIRDAVIDALQSDAATAGLELDVQVSQGVVQLFGTATDLDEIESAEEVTARVPGVVEVIEQLRIDGPETTNQ